MRQALHLVALGCGEENRDSLGGLRLCDEAAIAWRKSDVHHRTVGPLGCPNLDGFGLRRGDTCNDMASVSERTLDRQCDQRLIFDNQYAEGFHTLVIPEGGPVFHGHMGSPARDRHSLTRAGGV
jgi:hypothetical protein